MKHKRKWTTTVETTFGSQPNFEDEQLHEKFMDTYRDHLQPSQQVGNSPLECVVPKCTICEENYDRDLARRCIRCGGRYEGKEGSSPIHLTCLDCDWVVTKQVKMDRISSRYAFYTLAERMAFFHTYCQKNNAWIHNVKVKSDPGTGRGIMEPEPYQEQPQTAKCRRTYDSVQMEFDSDSLLVAHVVKTLGTRMVELATHWEPFPFKTNEVESVPSFSLDSLPLTLKLKRWTSILPPTQWNGVWFYPFWIKGYLRTCNRHKEKSEVAIAKLFPGELTRGDGYVRLGLKLHVVITRQ